MRKEKENIILMRNSNWLLFLQILDAVRYLHEIGVVHRDLKLGKWNISNVDHISRYVLLKMCTLVLQIIFFHFRKYLTYKEKSYCFTQNRGLWIKQRYEHKISLICW